MPITDYTNLLRPTQWTKNLFVGLPLFFSGSLFDIWCLKQVLITFICFSLAASSVYCINDIKDIDLDLKHPIKKLRPIASGKVSVRETIILISVVITASAALCICLGNYAFSTSLVILIYLIINVAYCFILKQYAIIDVFIISSGFVLRLIAGGVSCGIWLSPWIVCLTFLIALFLAFAKRRDDVLLRNANGASIRKSTNSYSLDFIDQVLSILGSVSIVCYIIYTVSPEVESRMECNYVYVTSVFVLAGIIRYLQLATVFNNSGSPTNTLLKDTFIRGCIVSWVISFFIIIYL